MKPAWDKLAEEYNGSPQMVVADVDCTSPAGKFVCAEQEVTSYPTIKYYGPDGEKLGTKYEGGRDSKSLKKFVKAQFGAVKRKCNPFTMEQCMPLEQEFLAGWVEKSKEERKAEEKIFVDALSSTLKPGQGEEFAWKLKLLRLFNKQEGKKSKAKDEM
uniref:Thioredoxin domain-containing protein n=1 Tax=Noctiluca scintillans TaxID=2966 RepID=A0A7S1A9H9_NOCSC|mmetsp:Transcript_37079/g.98783  ORF Transcript_37079/g.98783 Transcript_37079/m.98783 type:complete len:158 (+) Transcript_37079:222-695(+)